MLPIDVVRAMAGGVAGSVVTSAKATVPFLARFIGQGVREGSGIPSILTYKIPAAPVPQPFDALVVM